jgi:hypothetical protein
MKKTALFFLFLFVVLFLGSQSKITRKYPVTDVDHSQLKLLTQPTEETTLDPQVEAQLKNRFSGLDNLAKLRAVHRYVRNNFTGQPARGALVARRSVRKMFKDGTISGCNDSGIVKTAILRALGFPVVYLNAAGINWARDFKQGRIRKGFMGHVFLEVYMPLKNKWIVLDSVTDEYIEQYDHNELVIPIAKPRAGQDGYFVYRKGRDHWTQGVKSNTDNRKIMEQFALHYDLNSIVIRPKPIKHLVRGQKQRKKSRF